MKKQHNERIESLPVEYPFAVLTGFVVIEGRVPVVLPAGATWPGSDALPASVHAILQPALAFESSGAGLSPHVSPAGIEAGQALAFAQALSRATPRERLDLMGQFVDLAAENLQTVGSAINVSRDGMKKLSAQRRSELPLPLKESA